MAGPSGSGKSYFVMLLIWYLRSRGINFQKISIGDIFRNMLTEEGKDPKDKELLRQKSDELFQRVSHYEFLDWLMTNTPKIDWSEGVIIIDGIRPPDTHRRMEELFPHRYALIYCLCYEEMRIKRIMKRDNISLETAQLAVSSRLEVDYRHYFLRNATLVLTTAVDPQKIINMIMPSLLRSIREK